MTHTRTASRQAWRRLRKRMSDGELADIAADLGDIAREELNLTAHERAELVDALAYGLMAFPWGEGRQV